MTVMIEAPAVEIREATADDLTALAELLVSAYDGDPVTSWLFPPGYARDVFQPRFFHLFLDLALTHGTVHVTSDLSAAALWFNPDEDRPDPEDPREFLRLARACGPSLPRFMSLDALTGGYHPEEPHTFLTFLAVCPEQQGQGIGTALLRHRLATLAPDRPAYVEATSVRNADLFRRLGFRPLARTRSAGVRPRGGPTVYPMWRAAVDGVAVSSRV